MSADLFGVTLPEMIRELELCVDALRAAEQSIGSERASIEAARRIEILLAAIARLKRGTAEAA